VKHQLMQVVFVLDTVQVAGEARVCNTPTQALYLGGAALLATH
jgi:hypothetical protein